MQIFDLTHFCMSLSKNTNSTKCIFCYYSVPTVVYTKQFGFCYREGLYKLLALSKWLLHFHNSTYEMKLKFTDIQQLYGIYIYYIVDTIEYLHNCLLHILFQACYYSSYQQKHGHGASVLCVQLQHWFVKYIGWKNSEVQSACICIYCIST